PAEGGCTGVSSGQGGAGPQRTLRATLGRSAASRQASESFGRAHRWRSTSIWRCWRRRWVQLSVRPAASTIGHTWQAPTELIFVRHGESNFNRDRRWQGQSQEAVLSDLGWRQAGCVGDALADAGAAVLFSSDLARSMQTSVAIAAATHLPIYPDARVREIDAGRWTNRLSDEVQKEEPDRVRAWNEAPFTTSLPEGEGLTEAQARILAFVAEAIPAYEGKKVIVSLHGAILQTVMAAAD